MLNIYKDKEQTFECDVKLDGATHVDLVRLIIENNNLSYCFNGEIKDSKCKVVIPILDNYNLQESGKIKLELVAENIYFQPWNDQYKLSSSIKIENVETKQTKLIEKLSISKPKISTKSKNEKIIKENKQDKKKIDYKKLMFEAINEYKKSKNKQNIKEYAMNFIPQQKVINLAKENKHLFNNNPNSLAGRLFMLKLSKIIN